MKVVLNQLSEKTPADKSKRAVTHLTKSHEPVLHTLWRRFHYNWVFKKKNQQPQHIVVPVVLQYIILFPLYRGTYHIARFMLTHSPMVHKLWSTICCHLCFFFFNNSHCENHSSSFITGPLIQTGWPFPVKKDSPWLNSGSLNLYQNLTSCVS